MLDINDFLDRIKKKKILVIGDIMLDEYLWGKAERISPEAPVPVVSIDKREHRLGGAANVALNLAKLGIPVALASVTGNDINGRALLSLLKKNKIDTTSVITDKERITTSKTRVLARNQQIIRMDEETVMELSPAMAKELIASVLKTVGKFKPAAIILEDYDKGVLCKEVIKAIIQFANKNGIITSVDPKKQHFFDYDKVTLFKPNLRELKEALHVEPEPTCTGLDETNHALLKKIRYDNILITLSEHGIYHSSKKVSGIIAAHKRDISDVSGAGDTVIAVATAALASGYPLHKAAAISNLAGGLVCEYAGVVPIMPEMLKQSAEQL